MPTLEWQSCTGGSTDLAAVLEKLRGCASSPSTTALSDIRVPLLAATLYLVTLSVLSFLSSPSFAHRKPFIYVAACHNAFLSLASFVMLVGALSAAIEVTRSRSLSATVCTPFTQRLPPEMQFWLYVFYVSKYYELLDTPILLLRGRSLTLLHVWHHTSVMFETWTWLEGQVTVGLYGMLFNTFVHVIMYAYYAAALLKIPFPMKRSITTLQIVQFVTSFTSLVPWAILHRRTGCTGAFGLLISALINASYLLLFIRFYKRAYGKRTGRKKGKSE